MLGFNLSPLCLFLFVQVQFKEMGQGMDKHFIEANTRVANKHVIILSASFFYYKNANEYPYRSQYPLPMLLTGWLLCHLLGWCRWDDPELSATAEHTGHEPSRNSLARVLES